jgi:hypothetical protein
LYACERSHLLPISTAAYVPREHVIPQSFGVFTPDLTLDCVCGACNGYFGSKLDWPMSNESIEGALRLQFGFKGTVGGIGTKAQSQLSPKGKAGKVLEPQSGQIRTESSKQRSCRG